MALRPHCPRSMPQTPGTLVMTGSPPIAQVIRDGGANETSCETVTWGEPGCQRSGPFDILWDTTRREGESLARLFRRAPQARGETSTWRHRRPVQFNAIVGQALLEFREQLGVLPYLPRRFLPGQAERRQRPRCLADVPLDRVQA